MTSRAGHCTRAAADRCWFPECECPRPEFDPGPMPLAEADGADLLDEVAAWIGQYLSLPSPHCITVIVLWAAHTHATEVFYVTPRLILDSAEPESGKTRVLELLNLITRAPIFTMNTTIAALYRRLAGEPRTILLDETDAVFAKGAAQNHEDLRALLNAGYKRGATVDRCVGDGASMKVIEFPVFASAALAGIAGNMPATITTRAVTVHMRRRAPDEDIAEFIEEDALDEAAPLREALSAWAAEADLKGARPVMPAGVADRKAEVWRALLAVADAAGAHWPDTARQACRHFVLATDPSELSLGVRLLADLRDVFGDHDVMPTAVIVDKLEAIEDGPWADMYGKPIDARRLSRMLGKYQVKPKVVRIGDSTHRGYTREALTDAWRRYLDPPGCVTSETNVTPLVSDVTDPAGYVTSETNVTPLTSDVTDVELVTHTSGTCTECGEPLDQALIAAGFTTHGEDEADPAAEPCSRCGERPAGNGGRSFCGPCIAEVHEEGRQLRERIAKLRTEQEAELEHVQTWKWDRLVPSLTGNRKQTRDHELIPGQKLQQPKPRRRRETVVVSRHPTGWISNLGSDPTQVCNSIFDIGAEAYHEFHGDNGAVHPAIWKCQEYRGKSRGTRYFCDAHLPDEFRPSGGQL